MKHYRKFIGVGPGGINCPCCFPGPGNRKEEFRKAKRRERREAMRIERQQMIDNNHRI